MKGIFILSLTVVLVLIFGAGLIAADQKQSVSVNQLSHKPDISRLDVVEKIIGQVNRDRVLTDLRRVTGEEPICTLKGCFTIKNRLTGSEGLQWAQDYIYEELVSLGYSVELRDWSRAGKADQNLIARKPGSVSPDEEIYFVAHLDGVNPDGAERSPAADDNASGAVAVLELARVLSEHEFHRTVIFFFSSGEEEGVLGVHSYVDDLSAAELEAIQYVVSVEMLSYDKDRDGAMQLWSGDHPPSLVFAQMLSEIINAYKLDLSPRVVTGCT